MSAAVKTIVPSHAHKSIAPSSRSSGANRTANDIIEQIRAAETRSIRPRSHAGSLVVATKDREIEDINAEIAALEAEARAKNLERKAWEERDLAYHIREHDVPRRSLDEDVVFPVRRSRYAEETDLVVYDRSRSLNRGEDVYITPAFRREEVVVRRKSPVRNVIRVEKDRKGRMALVRSAH